MSDQVISKIGVAGCGALGRIVTQALIDRIHGYDLIGISDNADIDLPVPNLSFDELIDKADILVECLPAAIAADFARLCLQKNKTLVMISSAALLIYPDLKKAAENSKDARILVPSGALSGLDAVQALRHDSIHSAELRTTKGPQSLKNAPYIQEHNIDLDNLTEKTLIFSGPVTEAAKAFPANVNVAATLSIAGNCADILTVEIWADPTKITNSHEITVVGERSTITSKIENTPDPSNPKSSKLAAYSIIALLHRRVDPLSVV